MNDDKYMRTVLYILDRGMKTNSYKFVLLRSLSLYGKDCKTGDKIEYKWLAEKFLEFYWSITIRFKLRQAVVPEKDPVIMKYIREISDELNLRNDYKISTFKRRHSNSYDELIDRLCGNNGCFSNVIPRFHNIRGESIEDKLYTFDEDSRLLTLEENVSGFLAKHNKVLEKLAIGSWVKFTESFTTSPRVYEKIEGVKAQRRSLNRYREYFEQINRRCFYCNNENISAVDHFIPWVYVLEDKAWNFVLSCNDCNSKKSDLIPNMTFKKKLDVRNKGIQDRISTNNEQDTPISKEFMEWSNSGLKKHIDTLYSSAISDGFNKWKRDF